LVGFAALFLIGFAWTYLSREQSSKDQFAQTARAPLLAASLDYSAWTAERSASPAPSKRETPAVARARLALTLILPIGTEDGSYSVQIVSASGEIVSQATGIAQWTGKAETLHINVDLRRTSAGAYTIAIQRPEESPRTYPVRLQ